MKTEQLQREIKHVENNIDIWKLEKNIWCSSSEADKEYWYYSYNQKVERLRHLKLQLLKI